MALAGVVMAEAVWFVARHVGANSGTGAIVRTVAGTVAGAVVYVVMLVVLRTPELELLKERFVRRPAATTADGA